MNEIADQVMDALADGRVRNINRLFAEMNIRGSQHNIRYFRAVLEMLESRNHVVLGAQYVVVA